MNLKRIRVTSAQAELCASFMLDMDPEELAAPISVLDALRDCEHIRDTIAYSRMASAIERWAMIDRKACVGLLGAWSRSGGVR